MSLILSVTIFCSLAAVSYVAFKKIRGDDDDDDKPAGYLTGHTIEDQLLGLKLNDIVSHLGTDYQVEGRLDYNEDGYTWSTFMLVDGAEVRWLTVEEDDRLEVSMWEEIEDLHVTPPVPEYLEYQGERYEMVERGKASVERTGQTGNKQGMHVEFYDYRGRGAHNLAVEKWGGEIEVSIGSDIKPRMLEIFPGDNIVAN